MLGNCADIFYFSVGFLLSEFFRRGMSKALPYFTFLAGSPSLSSLALLVSLMKWSVSVQGGAPNNFLGYVEQTRNVLIVLSKRRCTWAGSDR